MEKGFQMDDFKDLNLNRDKIEEAIKFYCKNNYSDFEIKKEDHTYYIRYNITYNCDNEIFLDVFYTKKGTTTIQTTNGKNTEEKAKIAKYISNSEICKIGENENINKSVLYKNISLDDFKTIIELIPKEQYFNAELNRKENTDSIIIKLEGKWNDKITLTYYKSTKNVRLQGKPLALFFSVSSLFNELLPCEDIISHLDEEYSMELSPALVEEQYKALLPNSHQNHSEKLKKSLLKSVYNLNVEQDNYNYTCTELVFEVLRALEGHIKITLFNHFGIHSTNQFGTLDMFSYNYDEDVVTMNPQSKNAINNDAIVSYYESAYMHLVKHRHRIFHWDNPTNPIDTTEQLFNVNDAKEIIRDTLKVIDKYYEQNKR